jgi:hypothetical protein
MNKKILALSGLLMLPLTPAAMAGDLGINVVVAGEIAPGVYGQVELGNRPPPPVVYGSPVIIKADPRYARAVPVYLHVPPGHAKNWSKHCDKYNACGRKVYFVKSQEYEPEYQREHSHDLDHGGDNDHGKKDHGDHGHGKGKDKGKDKGKH